MLQGTNDHQLIAMAISNKKQQFTNLLKETILNIKIIWNIKQIKEKVRRNQV